MYPFAVSRHTHDQAAEIVTTAGPADLREKLGRAGEDLAFVQDLDDIRMKRSLWVADGDGKGHFDELASPPAYRAAFRARELDVIDGDPADTGDRVRASGVRAWLVAALDDWALLEANAAARDRVLAVARRADPGPWLDRFRDPVLRAKAAEVWRLASEADPAAMSAGTLTALAGLMRNRGLDPKPILRGGQLARPN